MKILRNLLIGSFLVTEVLSLSGEARAKEYIAMPDDWRLPEMIERWDGTDLLWEDEEFFISRVAPKKLLPLSDEGVDLAIWGSLGGESPLFPSGDFNRDIFSSWHTISFYGLMNSSIGWIPGCIADAAHKNGVGIGNVATYIKGNQDDAGFTTYINSISAIDPLKAAVFFAAHGVDGNLFGTEFLAQREPLEKFKDFSGRLLQGMSHNALYRNYFTNLQENGDILYIATRVTDTNASFLGTDEHPTGNVVLRYSGGFQVTADICRKIGRTTGAVSFIMPVVDYLQDRGSRSFATMSSYGFGVVLNDVNQYMWNQRTMADTPIGQQQKYLEEQKLTLYHLSPLRA